MDNVIQFPINNLTDRVTQNEAEFYVSGYLDALRELDVPYDIDSVDMINHVRVLLEKAVDRMNDE